MEESESSGGDRFYDMVYDAEDRSYFLKPLLSGPVVTEIKFYTFGFDLGRS